MRNFSITQRPPLQAATQLLQLVELPSSDLTEEHLRHFLFCGPADQITGLVGLEIYRPDALMRSLAVAPSSRRSGLGSTLVQAAEEYARARQVSQLFVITTTAQAFFEARGYRLTSRERCPSAICSTSEFTTLCPANSQVLTKPL